MLRRLVLPLLLCVPGLAAHAQIDPVGPVSQTGRYEGGQSGLLGRDSAGRTLCFRREEGSSHRLDIGVSRHGAFARLETPEPREATARDPVRVYAGQRGPMAPNRGDRFAVLAAYDGAARHFVANPSSSGFTLVATDAAAFLAVVAAARDHFLVVESRQPPAARESVAIYDFTRAAGEAMLACAARHVR